MKQRKSDLDLPPDETTPEDLARADGESAPSEEQAVPPVHASDEPAEPADPPSPPWPTDDAPALPAPDPSPPVIPPAPALAEVQDFPVASVLPPVAPLLATPVGPAPLEDRIRRLEAELALLRTGQGGETRFAVQQAANSTVLANPAPATADVRKREGFWAGLGKRLASPSGPRAAPATRPEGLAAMVPSGVRRTWMLLDALTELRAMYWMFFDPRYRLSWAARVGPAAFLGLILTSYFWAPGSMIPGVGWVIEKLVDLVLAYLLFKLLSYEARRYRETAPDLPPSLRL